MKKNFSPTLFILTISLLSFSMFSLSSCNDKWTGEDPQITKGRTLFHKYCTECHGPSGQGNKELLKQYEHVDLTRINARRDVDEFPVMEIAKYIDGREHYKDFGARTMPMWGVDMMSMENHYNPDTARTNLGAIISYLIKIQEEK